MVKILGLYDEHHYGKTIDEIESENLQKSHAIWGETGEPVSPPNAWGHVLIGLAQALFALFGALIASIVIGANFLSEDRDLPAELNDGAIALRASPWA